jgi:hypothetical protein
LKKNAQNNETKKSRETCNGYRIQGEFNEGNLKNMRIYIVKIKRNIIEHNGIKSKKK